MDFTGYTKYKGSYHVKSCDYYYAKSITDDLGKRYQIVFYVYDYNNWPDYPSPSKPINYMPEIYYRLDDDAAVFHTFSGFNDSITFVEMYADEMWNKLNRPYIELYEGGE